MIYKFRKLIPFSHLIAGKISAVITRPGVAYVDTFHAVIFLLKVLNYFDKEVLYICLLRF